VHELNDVRADRGKKHGGELDLLDSGRAGGVFAKFGPDEANKQWDLSFDDVADGTADKAVADKIRETGGKLSISLTNVDWALTGEGDEWMKRAAATVRLENVDGTRRPSQLIATNHMNWMRQTIFYPAQLDKAAALLESARVSTPQAQVSKQQEFPVLATLGKYTIYPMECCTEDQIATLFSKVCQFGNPVLQGRPAADLRLLGRAMYRKANLLKLGQVAVHEGEPVAMYVSWDVATGGVWQDSGLEMPASMAAHAACGKGAFDSLKARGSRGKTLFSAFGGVVPPHDGVLFCHFAVCSFMLAKELGFEDAFQFTLLPTLTNRPAYAKFGTEEENMNWQVEFADVAADKDKAVADELLEMTGMINCSLTNLNFAMEEGGEWMARAAATIKLKSAEEIRQPSQSMCTLYMEWLKHSHSSHAIKITSRL